MLYLRANFCDRLLCSLCKLLLMLAVLPEQSTFANSIVPNSPSVSSHCHHHLSLLRWTSTFPLNMDFADVPFTSTIWTFHCITQVPCCNPRFFHQSQRLLLSKMPAYLTEQVHSDCISCGMKTLLVKHVALSLFLWRSCLHCNEVPTCGVCSELL